MGFLNTMFVICLIGLVVGFLGWGITVLVYMTRMNYCRGDSDLDRISSIFGILILSSVIVLFITFIIYVIIR